MSETIKVRATELGYYEHNLRYRGDVFTLVPRETAIMNLDSQTRQLHQHDETCAPKCKQEGQPQMRTITAEEQFSAEWMERVDDDEDERVTGIGQALAQHTNEIRASKRPGRSRD